MIPSLEKSPAAYFAYQRARAKAIQARAEKKLGRGGVENATRRPLHLDATQRGAVERARRGPLGWLFAGSSAEDVVRDSSMLRKLVAIHRARPYLRRGGGKGSAVHLPSGKTVRFHGATGKVTPR
jgi:hypothetical protein